MVALSSLAGAGWQFFDGNGIPLSGGKLYTYAAGTTTPATTYTNSSGTTPHTNPIILDSAGRVPEQIWLTQGITYKFVLASASDVTLWTEDNIYGAAPDQAVTASDILFTGFLSQSGTVEDLGTADGSDWIGFKASTASAIPRSVQSKLRDTVSVKDFGAVGNGSANDLAAIQDAYAAVVAAGGGRLYFPEGVYLVTDTVVFNATGVDILIEGDSPASKIMLTSSTPKPAVYIGSGTLETGNVSVRNIGIAEAQGTGAQQPGNAGFYVENRPGVVFDRVEVTSNYVGIEFVQSFAPRIQNTYISYCGGSGIFFVDQSSNNAVIRDTQCISNGLLSNGNGIAIGGSGPNEAILLENCDCEGNYTGLLIQNTTSLTINNCYVENSVGTNFYMSGSNYAMTITGNWFGASPASIVQNVTGVKVENNTIHDTTLGIDTGGTALNAVISNNRLDGTGAITPNVSAVVDVYSTMKGIGIPSMSTTQKNAVANLRQGMLVFDNTLNKLCVYSGSAWQTVTSV